MISCARRRNAASLLNVCGRSHSMARWPHERILLPHRLVDPGIVVPQQTDQRRLLALGRRGRFNGGR